MSRLVRNTLLIAASGALALGLATTGAARGNSEVNSSVAGDASSLAVDMYLRLEGIEGESVAARYKGQIEVMSFSFGVTNAGAAGGRALAGAAMGNPAVQDISFSKRIDRSSPRLFESAASGRPIPQGVLTLVRAGGEQQEVARFKLSQVIVTSYQTSGTAAADAMDSFSLTFGSIEYEYLPVDATGKPSAPIKAMWNVGGKTRQ